jgi:hypothetical protein
MNIDIATGLFMLYKRIITCQFNQTMTPQVIDDTITIIITKNSRKNMREIFKNIFKKVTKNSMKKNTFLALSNSKIKIFPKF